MCLAPSGSPSGETAQQPFGDGQVGGQRVDPDSLGGQFERGGLGVVDDAGLGGGVGRVAGCRPHALDGRHVDDASRQTRRHQPL